MAAGPWEASTAARLAAERQSAGAKRQASAAIHSENTLVSSRPSGDAAAQLALVLSSEHESICSAAEKESSEAAANAPGVKGCGIDRTKGHGIRCG